MREPNAVSLATVASMRSDRVRKLAMVWAALTTAILFSNIPFAKSGELSDDQFHNLKRAASAFTATVEDIESGAQRNSTIIAPCLIALAAHVDVSRRQQLHVYSQKNGNRSISASRIFRSEDSNMSDLALYRTSERVADDSTHVPIDGSTNEFRRSIRAEANTAALYGTNFEGRTVTSLLPSISVAIADEGLDGVLFAFRYRHGWQPIRGSKGLNPNGLSSAPIFLIKNGGQNFVPIGLFTYETRSTALNTLPSQMISWMGGVIGGLYLDTAVQNADKANTFNELLKEAISDYKNKLWVYEYLTGRIAECKDEVTIRGEDIFAHYLSIDKSEKAQFIVGALRAAFAVKR